MTVVEKNIAGGTVEEILFEDGFLLIKTLHDTEGNYRYKKDIDRTIIQFHFCLKGSARFEFNRGRYSMNIEEDRSLLLYNPKQDLPVDLELAPGAWVVSVLVPIKKFHELFSMQAGAVPFLSEENLERKYYNQAEITPAMAVVLSQIINYNMHTSVRELYLKGKAYEMLSLYFNRNEYSDAEHCPFLIDEDNVRRIKKAKDIVIARMTDPPSLQELSEEIGLNLKKLKEGFKQVYGDSVYSFLFDYKMEYARKMLESGDHNVNEVGLRVGYSTASHFITAFKKKYGTTPKRYLKSLQNTQ